MSLALNISMTYVLVDKINCTTRSGAWKVFSLTRAQGGHRRRGLAQAGTPMATTDPYEGVDIAITIGFGSAVAAEQFALLLQSDNAPGQANLTAALQDVVAKSFPQGTQFRIKTLFVAVSYPQPPSPPPSPPPPSPPSPPLTPGATTAAPAPVTPVTLWATSAYSPRYAAGTRPAGTTVAAAKATGKPQLKPGVAKCAPNNAIAWVPTMGRPRKLEVFYSVSVTLGQVHAVVLSVINVGSQTPALVSLEILLKDGSSVTVYAGTHAGPNPACPALNMYSVPATAVAAGKAGVAVVGVRVVPNQGRVPGKTHLIHVSPHACILLACFLLVWHFHHSG